MKNNNSGQDGVAHIFSIIRTKILPLVFLNLKKKIFRHTLANFIQTYVINMEFYYLFIANQNIFLRNKKKKRLVPTHLIILLLND